VRELNDEINKHMRQKHYWEIRIRELGGGDYRASKGTQYYEIEGKELPGAAGYKYYGAAKELPGVRELFAEHEEALQQRRKQRCPPARMPVCLPVCLCLPVLAYACQ
jgi:pre-mRNA-splicing factor ISY1